MAEKMDRAIAHIDRETSRKVNCVVIVPSCCFERAQKLFRSSIVSERLGGFRSPSHLKIVRINSTRVVVSAPSRSPTGNDGGLFKSPHAHKLTTLPTRQGKQSQPQLGRVTLVPTLMKWH